MYSLRLFHQSNPSRQIESRMIESGELVIGREPGVGWKIDDPDRAISRSHCVLTLKNGQLTVRDTSSNGIFLNARTEAAPKGQHVPLQSGETIRLGQFTILIESIGGPLPARDPLMDTGADRNSPFAPPPGMIDRGGEMKPPNPFGGELPRDPLAFDPGRSGVGAGPLPTFGTGTDAWQKAPVRRAGDWDQPSRDAPDNHEHLIGSQRHWTTPPSAPVAEVGFGFDAPFVRPILQTPEVTPKDLAIPDDWDVGPPAVANPPPPAAPEPPREAFIPPAPPEPPQQAFAPPPDPAPPLAPEIIPPLPPEPPAADFAPPPVAPPASFEPPPVAATPPVFDAPIEPLFARHAPGEPIPPMAPPSAPAPVAAAPAPEPAPPARPAAADSALFEAFCAGAKLDPNAFAGEDRAAMMHKLGAVYQQMVLGLGDLLSERTSVKNEYRMIRTTVRADGNNPFKWAPPARVAVDLLRSTDDGFITGPPAVKESFEDLKKHLICLLAGLRASLSATLTTLSPETIEAQAKGGGGFGGKTAKAASAWTEFSRIYAEFKKEADDNPDSQINREFRAAYERQLAVLDGLKPPR